MQDTTKSKGKEGIMGWQKREEDNPNQSSAPIADAQHSSVRLLMYTGKTI